jgi:hypothetical protein
MLNGIRNLLTVCLLWAALLGALSCSDGAGGQDQDTDSGTSSDTDSNTNPSIEGTYFSFFPLEIIQPRPNLGLQNRFYKAYPGLEYNVRLAVIGGAYPYTFELSEGPPDMTMDTRGEITWPTPTEAGSPHTVSARVTDVFGSSTEVSWTITVTTAGFRFIDANNGTAASEGGTGAIDNPWRSMFDMYEGNDYDAKYRDSYRDEFVYWRAGTYTLDAYVENCTATCRVPFSNGKPLVWLAYPGETPVFDLNSVDNDAHISIYGGVDHTYFDSLEFNLNDNTRGMGITIAGWGNHVTFRRNRMYGLVGGWIGGNNSLIFITREDTAGEFFSLQDNVWSDVDGGYGLLGYSSGKVLVENNDARRIDGHPIGPKEGTPMWTIRGNILADNEQTSINLQYSNSHGIPSGDLEICFNTVLEGGGMVRINSNHTLEGLPVYVYRNTFMADIVDASRLVSEGNLVGTLADSIVDADGHLQGTYRTDYLNDVGAEISP